jgi:subtilisin family serine protease
LTALDAVAFHHPHLGRNTSMKRYLLGAILALLLSPAALAQMNGQLIDCDNPHASQPAACPDNWALDALDETKAAISGSSGSLPRDRKHYFAGTGAGVHIFIFDTGVDSTNPDFKVLDNPTQSRMGVPYTFTTDGHRGSHGTRTASLAGGLQYGVAKGATLHAVYSTSNLVPHRGAQLLDRLNWIYDRVTLDNLRPAVLNMSFNLPRPITDGTNGPNMEAQLNQRVRDLINAGVVVTVSAGNQNSNNPAAYWPSNIPEVILVGGVDQNGERWVRTESDPTYEAICLDPRFQDCGSNYGSLVDIWAPAQYIRAAVKKTNDDTVAPRVHSGTSFAAPLVAGLAALRLQQFPGETPAQVRAALLANAASIGDVDGNGTIDYFARSPVATPACNVPQRMFVNTSQTRWFYSSQMRDSCPAGYDAFAQFNALHGTVSIFGFGPSDAVYGYTPNTGYTGLDHFNYTIYNNTGGVFGNGTVKVTVQPDHN